MWNLLFEPLIGNFKSDVKFLIWIFFLWQLISCQTLKLRPKINVCKKNQISDRKIKSCWIDLIWNLLLDLTWFIFAVFDVKSSWLLIFMLQKKRAKVPYFTSKPIFSDIILPFMWFKLFTNDLFVYLHIRKFDILKTYYKSENQSIFSFSCLLFKSWNRLEEEGFFFLFLY